MARRRVPILALLCLSSLGAAPPAAAMGPMIDLADRYGHGSAVFAAGERIEVTVHAPALDVSAAVDVHTFHASASPSGGSLPFEIVETDRPGVFRARFETTLVGSADRLLVVPGDTIAVAPVLGDPGAATALVAESRLVFLEYPTGAVAETVLENRIALVRHFAPSLNQSPSVRETASVQVITQIGQDVESLTLLETDLSSGIFEHEAWVRGRTASSASHDQFVDVAADSATGNGDVIEAWPGSLPGFGDTVGVAAARVEILDRAGRPTGHVVFGRELTVRVHAPNRNLSSTRELVSVSLVGPAGDTESRTLVETDLETGIFEGSLPVGGYFAAAVPGNDVFEFGASDEVRVRFLDTGDYSPVETLGRATTAAGHFVDAQGKAVDFVVEDGIARLLIDSPQNNGNDNTYDFLAFVVTNPATGDSEYVRFDETTPDSGLFLGSLPLARSAAAVPSNGVLETSATGSPFIPENRVSAIVSSVEVSVPVVGARLAFVDRLGRETARFVAGEAARVRVEMPARDTQPTVADTISATLWNEDFVGEDAVLSLTETGVATGIFEAPIESAYRRNGTVLGVLDLALGDRVRLDVTDDFGLTLSARATAAYGRFDFFDAQGRPLASALEGTNVQIEATAPSENRTGAVDFTFGHAASSLTGDTVSLGLTETGPSTGVFRGWLGLVTRPTANYDTGILETWELPGPPHQFDRVGLGADFLEYGLYYDAEPLTLAGSRTGLLDAAGRPVTAVAVGSTVYLRVEDWNVNRISAIPGTATTTVRVRSAVTGDEELVTLVQEGRESPFFRGSVAVVPATSTPPGDGAVGGAPGGLLVAEHEDFVGYSFSSAAAELVAATVEFLDENGLPTSEVFENGFARVRVTSLANDSSSEPDGLSLQVSSDATGDEEFAQLVETGPSTHVFEGTVALPFGPAVAFDDRLQVGGPPDTVRAYFADFQASATARTIGARVRLVDAAGAASAAFAAGESMGIEIVDPSRDVSPGVDTVTITATPRQAPWEARPIVLGEVAPGRFRGAVTLHLDSHRTPDGLTVVRQDTVDLLGYAELNSGLPVTASVSVVDFRVLILDEAGQPTTEIFEGAPLRFRLIGEPADRNPNQPEGVEMYVVAEVGPDYENPYVVETGDHTGIFEGVIFTKLSSEVGPFNYQLELGEQAGPPLRLDHVIVRPFLTGSYYPLETGFEADASVRGSRTLFVDAGGAEASAVVIGTPARVRVWDWNRNLDPDFPVGPADTTTVTVSSGGDSEVLTVTEIANGIFEGDLPTRIGAANPGNGTLEIATEGDGLLAVHDDLLGNTNSRDEVGTNPSTNGPPQALPDAATTLEDEPVVIAIRANDSDPDGDPLSVSYVGSGQGAIELLPDGTLRYTPATDFAGTDVFEYEVADPLGAASRALVTVTVSPVNDPPVAQGEDAYPPEDTPIVIPVLLNDGDVDGDALTVAISSPPTHGTAAVQPDGTVLYTPAANYHGGDAFTYSVTDPSGASATATVTITVTAVNDPPVAVADGAPTAEDTAVSVDVRANDSDPDGDTLMVAISSPPASGTAAVQPDGTVLYTPAGNYHGGDAFTYSVTDPSGASATATVTITVTPVNDPPVAAPDSVSTTMESVLTFGTLPNDSDPDGDPLSISAVTQPANGTVVLLGPDSMTYTPNNGFAGTDTFTYTVSDGQGGTAVGAVTMLVNRPARIGTNLQVLYNFGEGQGTTVLDMSGVGTPLNLTIGNSAAVTWQPGRLAINSATLIQSAGAASKVIDAVRASHQVTMEAWVIPRNLSQTGPAAIATISQSTSQRNITLGQSTNRWDTRLRTSTSGAGGVNLTSANGSLSTTLTHIVFTRDASGAARVYRNGVLLSSFTTTGNFSTWVTTYRLGLGAELNGGRPWLGDLDLVAIYSRALTAGEVRQNFLAGPQ